MSDYIVQLKDDTGNKQYPVTLAQCIVDDDGTVIGEKLDMLETAITNLKTVGGQSIVGSNGGENIPFKKINVDGTSYDVVGSGTINITTSQDIDIKTLNDADGSHSLLGSGEVNFKKINNQSIFGEGQIDLSNLIVESTGIEYRPLLFEGDDVPEGYDSYTAYNAETYELVLEGKAVPTFMDATPSNMLFWSNIIDLSYNVIEDGIIKITGCCELDINGGSSTDFNGNTPRYIDASSLMFCLDNVDNNNVIVNSTEVIAYINAIRQCHLLRANVSGLGIQEPIAYITSSSDPTVSCIVNSSAVVGTGEGLIIEYDFGESRYRRTYTISGSNATYEEEEISLGGGAGEGAYIGPDQPDDNSRVNLWIDTDEGEEINGVIIGGDGYLGDLLIDTEMSDTSTNAVQNRVIKAYIDKRIEEELGNIKALLDQINGNA